MKHKILLGIGLLSLFAPLLAFAAPEAQQGPTRLVCSPCFPEGHEGKKGCYTIYENGKKTGVNCTEEMSSVTVAHDECKALRTSDSRCYN